MAFQELATRISHRNTGRYSDDPVADRIMVRIAADENLHMVFYRDIMAAALKLQPSAAVRAIVDEVLRFQMPGAGIPRFLRKAAEIAKAGIYDLRVHRDEVLLPILQHWRIFELTGLDGLAEEARRAAGRAPRGARRGREAVRGEARRIDGSAASSSPADVLAAGPFPIPSRDIAIHPNGSAADASVPGHRTMTEPPLFGSAAGSGPSPQGDEPGEPAPAIPGHEPPWSTPGVPTPGSEPTASAARVRTADAAVAAPRRPLRGHHRSRPARPAGPPPRPWRRHRPAPARRLGPA